MKWMDPNQNRAAQAAFDGYVPQKELDEALAEQRRRFGAQHDDALAELKRVREVSRGEIEQLQATVRRALKVADERSMQNTALRQENERLRALTTRLRTAAESVCWFDWSNNDRDAVEAITELRLALEQT